jgi:uncharacterized repeat protein (TIGR03803 family)
MRASTIALVLASTCLATASAQAAPRTEVLFSFAGSNGSDPTGVTADALGVLYGTTQGGGSGQCSYGCGTIFRLVPPAEDGKPWTQDVLYRFTGQADGAGPTDPPVLDGSGNLYGTARTAGDLPYGKGNRADVGGGVVWELSPPDTQGGAWTYQVLHTFTGPTPRGSGSGSDGAWPIGQLALSGSGVLYGTTSVGGTAPRRAGVAYSLTSPQTSGGTWTETILHDFNGTTDGQGGTPLALTGHGAELLGIASTYFLSDAESVLFDLRLGAEQNTFGRRAFTQDSVSRGVPLVDRNHSLLFGSSKTPSYSAGAIVEFSPPAVPGDGWTETILHPFTVESGQGYTPNISLLRTAGGILFGTTQKAGNGGKTADGSSGGLGAVFRLDPPVGDSTTWTYSELHQFDGSPGVNGGRPDAGYPDGALVFGRHHQIYGTSQLGGRYGKGTVFVQIWL